VVVLPVDVQISNWEATLELTSTPSAGTAVADWAAESVAQPATASTTASITEHNPEQTTELTTEQTTGHIAAPAPELTSALSGDPAVCTSGPLSAGPKPKTAVRLGLNQLKGMQ